MIRAWQLMPPMTGWRRRRSLTSMPMTSWCSTATCRASTGTSCARSIADHGDRVMVLMLTAADAPGDRVAGLGLGADDYLAKPFHFPELVLRIRALARRQPSARGRVLRADGVESTRCGASSHATAASWTCPSRSSACLRRCCGPARRLCARGPARAGLGRTRGSVHQRGGRDHRPARRKLGNPPVIATTPGVGYRIVGEPGAGVNPARRV